MATDIKTEETKELILGDSSRFSYTIKQVEIANILGTAVAVLDEYFITGSGDETYKLYKTSEGNWYDVPEANKGVEKGVLLGLKFAIDADRVA